MTAPSCLSVPASGHTSASCFSGKPFYNSTPWTWFRLDTPDRSEVDCRDVQKDRWSPGIPQSAAESSGHCCGNMTRTHCRYCAESMAGWSSIHSCATTRYTMVDGRGSPRKRSETPSSARGSCSGDAREECTPKPGYTWSGPWPSSSTRRTRQNRLPLHTDYSAQITDASWCRQQSQAPQSLLTPKDKTSLYTIWQKRATKLPVAARVRDSRHDLRSIQRSQKRITEHQLDPYHACPQLAKNVRPSDDPALTCSDPNTGSSAISLAGRIAVTAPVILTAAIPGHDLSNIRPCYKLGTHSGICFIVRSLPRDPDTVAARPTVLNQLTLERDRQDRGPPHAHQQAGSSNLNRSIDHGDSMHITVDVCSSPTLLAGRIAVTAPSTPTATPQGQDLSSTHPALQPGTLLGINSTKYPPDCRPGPCVTKYMASIQMTAERDCQVMVQRPIRAQAGSQGNMQCINQVSAQRTKGRIAVTAPPDPGVGHDGPDPRADWTCNSIGTHLTQESKQLGEAGKQHMVSYKAYRRQDGSRSTHPVNRVSEGPASHASYPQQHASREVLQAVGRGPQAGVSLCIRCNHPQQLTNRIAGTAPPAITAEHASPGLSTDKHTAIAGQPPQQMHRNPEASALKNEITASLLDSPRGRQGTQNTTEHDRPAAPLQLGGATPATAHHCKSPCSSEVAARTRESSLPPRWFHHIKLENAHDQYTSFSAQRPSATARTRDASARCLSMPLPGTPQRWLENKSAGPQQGRRDGSATTAAGRLKDTGTEREAQAGSSVEHQADNVEEDTDTGMEDPIVHIEITQVPSGFQRLRPNIYTRPALREMQHQ